MTIACRGLKLKDIGHGQGHGSGNAVSLSSIGGSLFFNAYLCVSNQRDEDSSDDSDGGRPSGDGPPPSGSPPPPTTIVRLRGHRVQYIMLMVIFAAFKRRRIDAVYERRPRGLYARFLSLIHI